MYRLLLLLTLAGANWIVASAQSPFPCGTIGGRSEWLKAYQANPEAYPKNLDTLLYVPLTIHLVGNDAGIGHFQMSKLLDAFCRLNADFEESNIQFYIAGDILYYNNSDWYTHETVIDGGYMMLANNVENTINIYFVNDPAGNCGYNLPYAGIAMDKACSGPNDHTWAHEIGHALSVQHPFLGWEGGVSHDGSIPPDYNQPAPAFVTYDYTNFKDTLYLDTLIIDTALVELVDGSNCAVAADGFCDTSPDYLAIGWFCNGNAQSNIQQTDPTGATFQSDGTLIMGYAADNCQARFTPEQIGAMRANLYDEKPELLVDQSTPEPLAQQPVELLYPAAGDPVDPFSAWFEWEPAPGAQQYLLEVSLLPNFVPTITQEYVTASTNATVGGLLEEKTYYWRVRAFNTHAFCGAESATSSFVTTTGTTSTLSLATGTPVRVYPNPLRGQGILTIEKSGIEVERPQILDLHGKAYPLAQINGRTEEEVQLRLPALSPGLYILRWEDSAGRQAVRIVIQ